MNAVISECGKYRYSLTRDIGEGKNEFLTFVMLNPSTADAELDDPTIRKCKGFCQRLEFRHLQVVNLFAFRATNPKELKTAIDPIGKGNMDCIRAVAILSNKVICAWGTNGVFGRQNERVLDLLRRYNTNTYALGITKDGHPKHPLYIPYDAQLVEFGRNNP